MFLWSNARLFHYFLYFLNRLESFLKYAQNDFFVIFISNFELFLTFKPKTKNTRILYSSMPHGQRLKFLFHFLSGQWTKKRTTVSVAFFSPVCIACIYTFQIQTLLWMYKNVIRLFNSLCYRYVCMYVCMTCIDYRFNDSRTTWIVGLIFRFTTWNPGNRYVIITWNSDSPSPSARKDSKNYDFYTLRKHLLVANVCTPKN